ncbi:MAG: 2Fe-2S iron-sulfur cluster-binding protein [Steroidobacteraceae bacterium]
MPAPGSSRAFGDSISFFWNGAKVPARTGDSIASALWRHGILTLGVSRKRHRPLGVSGSHLQGVLVTVDGCPHVRADETAVAMGLDVRRQNVWPSGQFDLLQALRFVPSAWVRGGFEQARLFPGGTRRFSMWERLLMYLSGEVDLDPHCERSMEPLGGNRLNANVVVVGGGPAGRRAANESATAGLRVVLISRSTVPGSFAAHCGVALPPLDARVTLLPAHTAVGVYREGHVVLAAPVEPTLPATLIVTNRLVLATGRRSCPPLVPGHDLPGVVDAHVALQLVAQIGDSLGATVVLGTGGETLVAQILTHAGANVMASGPIAKLTRVNGRNRVQSVQFDGRRVACRTVVHAGPWITDPSLGFQASAAGVLRLVRTAATATHIEVVGSAAEVDEPPHVGELKAVRSAAVCPCMDVTVGELLGCIEAGETHIEVLKRATSCGMGPCQGFPCWELMRAVVRRASGGTAGDDRPSHRPPRRGITVEQAAGLDGFLEVE